MTAAENSGPELPRRGFLARIATIVIGGLIALVPFAAGLFVFADPLRRSAAAGRWVKVTTLAAVPDDGVPRRFTVIDSRVDAWNYYPRQPIGAIYLRRQKGQSTPAALQTVCPHAGCSINYQPAAGEFKCPCHNSTFTLDGQIIGDSPAPRPMDSLKCEVRQTGGVAEVWVEFEQFVVGVDEKIPNGSA